MKIFLLLLIQTASGQQSDLYFMNLALKDGLSSPGIRDIVRDYQGFLWIGSSSGLNRFDGYRFKTYLHATDDSLSLSSNGIKCLYTDSDKNLWIGTGRGLDKYDENMDRFMRITSLNTDFDEPLNITAITEGPGQTLWMTTNMGLIEFDTPTGKSKIYSMMMDGSYPIGSLNLKCLSFDNSGQLWVGTNHGLFLVNITNNTCNVIKVREKLPSDPRNNLILSLCPGEGIYGNNMWIGTETGLALMNIQNHTFKVFRKEIPEYSSMGNNVIKKIAGIIDGHLWLGTDEGLMLMDTSQHTFLNYRHDPLNENSIPNDYIASLFKEESGIVWLGTHNGIASVDTRRKKFLYQPVTLSEEDHVIIGSYLMVILKDQDENFWIGSDKGLLRRDNKGGEKWFRKSEAPGGIDHDRILNLYTDNSGNLWVCTPYGLYCYNEDKEDFTHISITDSTLSGRARFISGIIEVQAQQYLISTYGAGLLELKFEEDFLTSGSYAFSKADIGIEAQRIYNLVSDASGNIWIGTADQGIFKWEPSTMEISAYAIEESKESISSNIFFGKVIFSDRNDKIWAGSSRGLSFFNEEKDRFEKISKLPEYNILAIQDDSKGNIWFSTLDKIVVFNPYNGIYREYLAEYDFKIKMFNIRCSYQDASEKLYFGGIDGYISFNPEEIQVNDYIPNTVISQLFIGDKEVKPGVEINGQVITDNSIHKVNSIKLNHNPDPITINFSSLHFSSPESNRYSFKMEGFDSEWKITDGKQPFAIYSNLKPGDYNFRVKGTNSDGIWNEEHANLEIVVLKPWYTKDIALIIYFLVTVMLIYLIRRQILTQLHLKNELRIEKIEKEKVNEMNRLKLQFFTNISHEFRTPLTLIHGPINQLLTSVTDVKIVDKLKLMQRNSERLMHLINQFMDLRKFESGKLKLNLQACDIVMLVNNVFESFREQADIKGIRFELHTDLESLQFLFDNDKIEKTMFNLLSNAFKHVSSGESVELRIEYPVIIKTREHVSIAIEDSGTGIDPSRLPHIFTRFYQADHAKPGEQEGSGVGLSMCKEYVDLHGGELSVKSEEAHGAEFTIFLPFLEIQKEDTDPGSVEVTVSDFEAGIENPMVETKAAEGWNNILVVEDNDDMRKYIIDSLCFQYKLIEARDGVSGLKLAKKLQPNLIVSDVMMPGMDGYALCQAVKTDIDTSHIPLILLTAKNSPESVSRGLSEGADDYISKPFVMEHLQARIANLLKTREKLIEKFSNNISFEPSDITITSMDEIFMKNVIACIEDNMDASGFNVKDLSASLFMSHSKIYRKIKAITHMTANQFIRSIRLKRAAKLLWTPGISISEVMYEVGFSNRSYFGKCFQDQFGMTPRDYFRKYANSESKIKNI